MEIAVVRLLAGCGRFKVRCRKFTDWARRQARLPARVLIKSSLFAYGFLKVALPSHSDRIADFPEGPSRRSGHSLVRSRTAGIDPKRPYPMNRITPESTRF